MGWRCQIGEIRRCLLWNDCAVAEHRGPKVFGKPALAADGHHRISVAIKVHAGDAIGRGGGWVELAAAVIRGGGWIVVQSIRIGASSARAEFARAVVDNGFFRIIARFNIGAALLF